MKPRTATNRILTVLLLGGFFFATAGYAFAQTTNENSSNGVSKIINYVIHVASTYTAAGVAVGGTQTTNQTVQTSSTFNGKTTTSTQTSTSVTQSTFLGGSVKPVNTETTSTTNGQDQSFSTVKSTVTYTYNGNGQLGGAGGTSTISSNSGKDANGQPIGTTTGTQTDTYDIRNGQAVKTHSDSNYINYGPTGTKTGTSTETVDYTSALLGGQWQVTKEVSTSNSSGIDGGSSTMTKTKTYARDAAGLITSVTQTATGSQVSVGTDGSKYTFAMKNYSATFSKDDIMGWYLKSETYDWVYGG